MHSQRFGRIKRLADTIGIEDLVRVEVEAVRTRPIPPRLIADLTGPEWTRLSPRQVTILALQSEGLTLPEVADRLGLALDTVKHHMKLTHRKLGTHNATQTAVRAIQIGYLQV